jgi:hypothetical protein
MSLLIPSFDPTQDLPTGPTSFMTERNAHEVRCGMCAREIYVDDETYLLGGERIDAGLENPFRCEICAEEYDEPGYET